MALLPARPMNLYILMQVCLKMPNVVKCIKLTCGAPYRSPARLNTLNTTCSATTAPPAASARRRRGLS